jgi:uncharacterized membrane protein
VAGWLWSCISVYGTAMIPISEVFAAVPLGLVLGLDPLSTVVSATLGNLSVAVLLHLFHDALLRIPRVRRFADGQRGGAVHARMARAGYPVLLVFTPLIGIYLSTVISRGLGMPARCTVPVKLVSVAIWCTVMVLASALPWGALWPG